MYFIIKLNKNLDYITYNQIHIFFKKYSYLSFIFIKGSHGVNVHFPHSHYKDNSGSRIRIFCIFVQQCQRLQLYCMFPDNNILMSCNIIQTQLLETSRTFFFNMNISWFQRNYKKTITVLLTLKTYIYVTIFSVCRNWYPWHYWV